ncbi:MAG: alpha-amylase [Bacteroidales bacterium]|jgi:maltose alpha-D-glucosyltransferase/alpha-amylase|nr:alpha-amylase family glycosyl hydrolase [Bacteroidota bacterium]NLN99141.1 alpha-amylase [Bacteroidales bacterium]
MNIRSFLFSAVCLVSAAFVSAQTTVQQPSWLSDAVFYQIYPSSYQDSDGNGIGDIPGITSRLEYIKSVGVSCIWLNPIFVSGWTDGGYDVIDFYKVDPRFGTNDDVVKLVEKAHSLDMKVVLDLVAGHSSIDCAWFKQATEASNLQYSDYYIWPSFKPEVQSTANLAGQTDYTQLMNSFNNIVNKFVKSDYPRGPYYIKNFFDTQPALNFGFANPDPEHPWEQAVDAPGPMAMRREIKSIMAFWMDKGIDGFRVDMAASLVKNDFDKSATIKLWKEDLAKWFKENYPENVLIAEWFNPSMSIEAGFHIDFFCHDGKYNYSTLFFNTSRRGSDGVCYFDLNGKGELKKWLDLYQFQYNSVKNKGYVSMPSGNHDFTRLAAGPRSTEDQLKVAMTFFFTMPGVPFLFYGDEIGLMQNFNAPPKEGSGGRSGSRIPMLWDDSADAGFSTAPEEDLYLPLTPDPDRRTVQNQEANESSLLNYVRSIIDFRRANSVLGADADWKLVSNPNNPYPMIYERSNETEVWVIAINPSAKKVVGEIPSYGVQPTAEFGCYDAKVCNYKVGNLNDKVTVAPVSAVVYKVK